MSFGVCLQRDSGDGGDTLSRAALVPILVRSAHICLAQLYNCTQSVSAET